MKAVASYVRGRYPTTTPLVWDDMLRDIPEDQLSGGWGDPMRRGGLRCQEGRKRPPKCQEAAIKLPGTLTLDYPLKADVFTRGFTGVQMGIRERKPSGWEGNQPQGVMLRELAMCFQQTPRPGHTDC